MTSTLIQSEVQSEIQSELDLERSEDAEREIVRVWADTGVVIALLAFMIFFFYSVFLG